MNNASVITTPNYTQSQLMQEIVKIRYTDVEKERDLCKLLLSLADSSRDTYACAFANVYLFDSFLALGSYDGCAFYLSRADVLCHENDYEDLQLVLCNCAGLYYLKLNDEQTALSYFLTGLNIAERNGDYLIQSKLHNNIGVLFGGRSDWLAAQSCFHKALEALRPHVTTSVNPSVADFLSSYLSNFSEASQNLGDMESSRVALEACEQYGGDGLYQQLRLACGWCVHYGSLNDRARCVQWMEKALNLGLLEYNGRLFVSDMCVGLCEQMLRIKDKKRVSFLIEQLKTRDSGDSLTMLSRILQLEINYFELWGEETQLDEAYQRYYELAHRITEMDDDSRAQSMLSKIHLTEIQSRHKNISRENSRLELVGQIDELTGLYNRRYFNKLSSKLAQNENPKTLGYIMIDIDYFKPFNDFYGHFLGDMALKAVAKCFSDHADSGIYPSRYGGDEFVCLCVNQSDSAIESFIGRIRDDLTKQHIPHEKSLCANILTLSIGYCNERTGAGLNLETLLKLADDALYQVKESGRNGWQRKRPARL